MENFLFDSITGLAKAGVDFVICEGSRMHPARER
jgi:hypothetical protein